jgi:hypothetical protein
MEPVSDCHHKCLELPFSAQPEPVGKIMGFFWLSKRIAAAAGETNAESLKAEGKRAREACPPETQSFGVA